jgi:hypothetical protein
MIEWPELEAARRRKETIRAIEEYIDNRMKQLEQHAEGFSAKPHFKEQSYSLTRIRSLLNDWDNDVRELLSQLGEATWGEKKIPWRIKIRLQEMESLNGYILSWQAVTTSSKSYRNTGYYVYLLIDSSFNPINFLVECGDKDRFIRSGLSLCNLKSVLLDAFENGPVRHMYAEDNAGVPIEP